MRKILLIALLVQSMFINVLQAQYTDMFEPRQEQKTLGLFAFKSKVSPKGITSFASSTYGEESFIGYSIFTDFKGFAGDQPNGLVQSHLFFNLSVNDSDKWIKIFRNVVGGIALTKLENNLRYKSLYIHKDTMENGSLDTIKHLHYLDLVRYQNFEGYAKFNLLTLDLKKSTLDIPVTIYLDGFANILSTGIRDTTLGTAESDRTFSTTSFGYGGSANIRIGDVTSSEIPFDFTMGMTMYQVYNTSNNFVTTNGPLFHPENNPANYSYDGFKLTSLIKKYEFLLTYCRDNENPENKIFIRTQIHTSRVDKKYENLGYKHNSYLQVQLGYNAALKDLLPD